jgi:hypothetical protein
MRGALRCCLALRAHEPPCRPRGLPLARWSWWTRTLPPAHQRTFRNQPREMVVFGHHVLGDARAVYFRNLLVDVLHHYFGASGLRSGYNVASPIHSMSFSFTSWHISEYCLLRPAPPDAFALRLPTEFE